MAMNATSGVRTPPPSLVLSGPADERKAQGRSNAATESEQARLQAHRAAVSDAAHGSPSGGGRPGGIVNTTA